MSIYATLWSLKFPRYGDSYMGCEWVEVWAQAVPEHVGRPTGGRDHQRGDPFAGFLPGDGWEDESDSQARFRAVVFVTAGTPKGADGLHPEEYQNPLLVLSGVEYRSVPFAGLHERLCNALRGDRPRVIGEMFLDGRARLVFDDSSHREVPMPPQCRPAPDDVGRLRRPWWRFW
jgi:hypothetical protein